MSSSVHAVPGDFNARIGPVELAELHDLSTLEIASAMGVPENTAKSRLFRAREKLRHLLASWIEPRTDEEV